MEQQDKHLSDLLRAESVKWACDVLDLAPQVCDDSRKNVSRQAVGAFFESLKANDFYVESDEAEAVELVLGNPAVNALQFSRHLNQQGFQRLDGVVEWFANELGVMHGPSLLNGLEGRLANLNLQGCSEGVHRYVQRILQSGRAVDRKVLDANPAVTKILQALFHISTVRQSQRCCVRSQWTGKLRSEFSVDELGSAKQIAQRTAVVPDARFHRPFLFMLTRKVADLDQRWLPPPVNSRRSAPVQERHFSEPSTKGSSGDGYLGWIILLALLVGIISSCVRTLNNSSSNSNSKPKRNWQPNSTWKQDRMLDPNWRPGANSWQPNLNPKLTVDPNAKGSIEALRFLVDEGKEQEIQAIPKQVEELNKTKPGLFDTDFFEDVNRNLQDIPKTDFDKSRRLRDDR